MPSHSWLYHSLTLILSCICSVCQLSLLIVVCMFDPCIIYHWLLLSVHLFHVSFTPLCCGLYICYICQISLSFVERTFLQCGVHHCLSLSVHLFHVTYITVGCCLYLCYICRISLFVIFYTFVWWLAYIIVCCWMYICSIWWILLPVVVSTFVPCVRYNCLFFSVVATCSAVATTVAATRVVMDLISYLGEFEILTWA